MSTVEQIKREIVQQLCEFKSPIHIRHNRADELMQEIIQEYPELLFYVQNFSSEEKRGFGYETCLTYRITYTNTDIPRDKVYKVNNRAELERKLQFALERYQLACGFCMTSPMDLNKIYAEFMVAYQGFYSNLLGIDFETMSFTGSSIQYAILRFRYRIGRVKLTMMEREVDREVERLGKQLFASEMDVEAKAYVAHNYLAKTVEYWLKEEANPLERSYMQSAYGALINHKCVCQGYAEAYKRLLDSQGIICDVICGKIRGSQEYHAWNVVSFDGKNYYHVDVTWDSRGKGAVGWEYFCKSDEQLRSTRIWTRKSGVICSSNENILAIARSQIASTRYTLLSKGIIKEYL